jgi:hypothetical protein
VTPVRMSSPRTSVVMADAHRIISFFQIVDPRHTMAFELASLGSVGFKFQIP